jgi:hypothetical protein
MQQNSSRLSPSPPPSHRSGPGRNPERGGSGGRRTVTVPEGEMLPRRLLRVERDHNATRCVGVKCICIAPFQRHTFLYTLSERLLPPPSSVILLLVPCASSCQRHPRTVSSRQLANHSSSLIPHPSSLIPHPHPHPHPDPRSSPLLRG